MAVQVQRRSVELGTSSSLFAQMRGLVASAGVTLFALAILSAFLMPLGYMSTIAVKNKDQISTPNAPILPSTPAKFEYDGELLDVYQVPTDAGTMEWALYEKGRESSTFIDPANPAAGAIPWEGRWRTLQPAWESDPQWSNFSNAWELSDFGRLLRNTLLIAVPSTIGAVLSSAIVAYGFTRFRFPGKRVLFMILLGTIILPFWVTLIPTYALFLRIGWVGTFLPLVVPHFFANAWNVFLLRQYFLGLSRELDEAAMIDGAGPWRILFSVILPQAVPALMAVTLFHFFFAWNDFFGPLLYLSGSQDLQPISVGMHAFNGRYSVQPNMIQATALLAMAIPVTVFFFAQRFFMQGVKITGVEK